VVRDKSGRALYSWRALILPYLEAEAIYRQFKLDEPWDSPNNRILIAHMPKVFAAPAVEGLKTRPGETFYQVLVGTETAFPQSEGIKIPDDFPDGTANTWLVVEAGESVPWTKPADLEYAADQPLPTLGGIFNTEGRFSLFGSNRQKGFNVAFVDGSIRFFKPGLSETNVRAFITRNGGEKIHFGDDG
jgi:prepilin-type processing-associated H-X9-DG protein